MEMESGIVAIAKVAIIAGLIAAVAFDVRYRVIPDVATGFVAGGGLLLRLVAAPTSVWWSLLAAAAVLAAFLVFAWRGMLGAGDAKLIAAATLTEPARAVPSLVVDIALAGGVLAGIFLLASWAFEAGAGQARRKTVLHRFFGRKPKGGRLAASIPYATAILGGVMWRLMSEAG